MSNLLASNLLAKLHGNLRPQFDRFGIAARLGRRLKLGRLPLPKLTPLKFAGLSLACLLLLTACQRNWQPANSPGSPTASPPPLVLRIAIAPSFAPFEFKTAGGILAGFDVDLINAIGSAAGFLIDFQEMTFEELIRSLYSRSTDAAISAITITPDRAAQVSFSRPYFRSGLAIAVGAGSPEISAIDQLVGKRLGAEAATTGAAKAQTVSNAQVLTFPSSTQALQALANGEVDAVINDAPVLRFAASVNSAFKVVGPLLTEEFYGIATPKNSPTLDRINAGLSAVIDNGGYATIYKRWFGIEPPPLPEKIE